MVKDAYLRDGYAILPFDPAVHEWSQAALIAARKVLKTPGDLRHGQTWRVGVDELPNAPDGSIGQVPLRGPWIDIVDTPATWHRAQLSVIYAGYPQQDAGESDASHRFRLTRDAAHLDGLLPEGTHNRRHLREPHAFILGLPLNRATQSPLVVWAGSHHVIKAAFAEAFSGIAPENWGDVDVTEIYQTARREVFATCPRITCRAQPGEATLIHRHLIHGVAPWTGDADLPEGRIIAYFRPIVKDTCQWA